MLLAFFSALLLTVYAVIRYIVSSSGVRYLVDTYGMDKQKLGKLKYKEIATLRKNINQLRKQNDAFSLEELVRKYRPLWVSEGFEKKLSLNHSATVTNPIMIGTSTKGPITAAKAAPELIPNTAIATAIANSKLLLDAVKDKVQQRL